MRGKVLLLLCGLVAITFAPPARAVDPNTDGWEFKAAPYIWAVSLDGDMTVKGNTVAVDVNIIDIIEESDSIFALEGYFEARRGDWDPIFLAQERASDMARTVSVSVNTITGSEAATSTASRGTTCSERTTGGCSSTTGCEQAANPTVANARAAVAAHGVVDLLVPCFTVTPLSIVAMSCRSMRSPVPAPRKSGPNR